MAVNVLITDRKFFNQYANSADIGSNLTNFNTYLRGGVINNQKVVYTVEIDWMDFFIGESSGNTWSVEDNVLTRNTGSWIDEGFSIGDTIDLALGDPLSLVFSDRVITNITNENIFFDGAAVAAQESNLGGLLTGGKTDLFGLEYSFGIINNNDEPVFKSLLDNSDQTYYADGVGAYNTGIRDTNFVEMQPKSQYNLGWDSSRGGRTKVRFVSRPSTYTQRFEIEHEFVLNPYNDQSLLDENNSFKYVSKFDFRSTVSNVNSSKISIDNLQLGSVGYFNENYDGYNNDFTISDLTYTDVSSGSSSTNLNTKSRTRVNFNVNSLSGLFSTDDPVVCFHSYMPDFNDYNKSALNYIDTWVYKSNRIRIDNPASSFNGIENMQSTLISANQISVQFEIEFTADEQQRIEEGDNYVLACEVGDGDIALQSKNVTLLVDENTYISDNNITNLIVNSEFGFTPYWNFIAPVSDLFTDYKGWVEDEVVSYARFGVNRTSTKDAKILNANFKLVAYEDATGNTFDLQNEQLDLSNQINAPINTYNSNPFTIQLIDDNRTRGYRLPNGDEFNLLLFSTDNSDSTYQYYEWRVGFKVNWQYWISLPNADNIFLNTNDTFNGLNNRASNYSLKNGWSIRVNWYFKMQGLDDDGNIGVTDYNFYSDQFSIFDFDEQDNDPTTWSCEIFTFDESGNDLNGSVIKNEYTNVKAVFTPQAPYTIDDIDLYWGELRIAEKNQSGFNNDVITTTKNILSDNRLIPLDNESKLKISLVSNTIELDGRVDFNNIKDGEDYKLSARLANVNDPPKTIRWIFRTEIDIQDPADGDFDPEVIASGGEVVTWTLKNGSNYNINTLSIPNGTVLIGDELNGACQDVEVTFSTNNPDTISEIDLSNDFICSDIDLSIFENMTDLYLTGNSGINNVYGFSTSTVWTNIYMNKCDLQGTLDLSDININGRLICNLNSSLSNVLFNNTGTLTQTNLQSCNITGVLDLNNIVTTSEFRAESNPLLEGVLFNSGSLSNLRLNHCDIQGNLDLSMIGLTARFIVNGNPNMTSITHNTSFANSTVEYYANNCNITGVHDISSVRITTRVRLNNNSITNVLFKANTAGDTLLQLLLNDNDISTYIDLTPLASFTSVNNSETDLSNNAITNAADINRILVDLDNNSVSGFSSRSIIINGGTNAAPDSTSGGYDGSLAKSNLQLKGFTVNTN